MLAKVTHTKCWDAFLLKFCWLCWLRLVLLVLPVQAFQVVKKDWFLLSSAGPYIVGCCVQNTHKLCEIGHCFIVQKYCETLGKLLNSRVLKEFGSQLSCLNFINCSKGRCTVDSTHLFFMFFAHQFTLLKKGFYSSSQVVVESCFRCCLQRCCRARLIYPRDHSPPPHYLPQGSCPGLCWSVARQM